MSAVPAIKVLSRVLPASFSCKRLIRGVLSTKAYWLLTASSMPPGHI